MAEIIINKYPEDGICYPRITINIRNIPCATTGTVLDQYYVGESVIYDNVIITEKYVWISWISGSGRRVYMAIKDQTTGERFGDCEDVPGNTVGTVRFLNLHPHMQRWGVYNENGPYTSDYAIGYVYPAQFGGLSYVIVSEKGQDVYVIDTASLGRCSIWAPMDDDSSITLSPMYTSNDGSDAPNGSETIVSEYPESGICYPQMTINIRSNPCATTGAILDQYYEGESVIYDYVVITNKYVWISWTSAGSGRRVYMAVKDQTTGERLGICDDVPSGGGLGNGMPGVKKVFIDPGHGGSDPGASGNGLIEKDIVLSIAKKLGSQLQSKGISVMYSRTTDVYVGLTERAKMANDWGADLFVSVHSNALDGSGSAYGTECYTHPNDVYTTKQLSADVSASISKKLGTYNRGHKNADFAVLRLSSMPAILVETAFIDNAGDANLLRNRQADFATAICDAITGSNSGSGSTGPNESNGFEHIVMSCFEFDSTPDYKRYKFNFIETALKKLHESAYYMKNEWTKNTTLTWLIDTTSYIPAYIENFKSTVNLQRLPVKMVFVNNLDQFINYMNTGTIDGTGLRKQFIKEFTLFGHGHEGSVDIGETYSMFTKDIERLNSTVFHSFFKSVFYSCNTGTGYEYSFANAWQQHLNGLSTQACFHKTDYNNILGDNELERKAWQLLRGPFGYALMGSRNYPVPDLDDPEAHWITFG